MRWAPPLRILVGGTGASRPTCRVGRNNRMWPKPKPPCFLLETTVCATYGPYIRSWKHGFGQPCPRGMRPCAGRLPGQAGRPGRTHTSARFTLSQRHALPHSLHLRTRGTQPPTAPTPRCKQPCAPHLRPTSHILFARCVARLSSNRSRSISACTAVAWGAAVHGGRAGRREGGGVGGSGRWIITSMRWVRAGTLEAAPAWEGDTSRQVQGLGMGGRMIDHLALPRKPCRLQP